MLWLWYRLAAAGPIRPIVWKLPYPAGAALKRQKKKKKKKKFLTLITVLQVTEENTLVLRKNTHKFRGKQP